MTGSETPAGTLVEPPASPEEAAAIVAAIERFMRATATRASMLQQAEDGWRRTALVEGTSRKPMDDLDDPWINT
jgi:hypothetical protein